ncbi:MAG: hypothetical protein H6734_07350 [Alphaproteobacteria bacterium]|nr:hypothetical protein [Alphaproteobacteria bacterium]
MVDRSPEALARRAAERREHWRSGPLERHPDSPETMAERLALVEVLRRTAAALQGDPYPEYVGREGRRSCKRASGRLKDLADVEELERIRR